MSYFIYINGFPGVGKLTVARKLKSLLPNSKVYQNHLLIDPIAPIVERTSAKYHDLRTGLRRYILNIIACLEEAKCTTWIFTDSRSKSLNGAMGAKDYENTARKIGIPFIPIILHCDLEENLKRVIDKKRRAECNTKLKDTQVLQVIRKEECIYQFGGSQELQLDTTSMRPIEVAKAIIEHISQLSQI